MPASRTATISSVVATGRRIKSREGFIRPALEGSSTLLRPAPLSLADALAGSFGLGGRLDLGTLRGDLDARSRPQPVEAVRDQRFAGGEAFAHRDALAFGGTQLHGALGHGLVRPHDVDEKALRAALHGSGGNDDDVAQRIELHAHVDELVRKQRAVVIRELRLELHRAGGRIDLVVGRGERPFGESCLLLAVPYLHLNLLAGLHALHDDRDAVLRHGEYHRDRLQLSDHDQTVRVARAYHIAGVNQAQTYTAADRGGDARVHELQLRAVDLAAVDLHRAFVLAHQRGLGIDLLLRDR